MIVKIPDNLVLEREYIINLLLKDGLNLEFTIQKHKIPEYSIEFDNKKIVVKDSFFYKFDTPKDYLKISNLPKQVIYAEHKLLALDDLPVIFGDKNIQYFENKIIIGADIFASAYFLLTDWESYVKKTKNKYGLFPEQDSFVYKNRLYIRPVVNEYIELIRNALRYLGYNISKQQNRYSKKLLVEVVKLSNLENITFIKLFQKIFRKKDKQKLDFIDYFTQWEIETWFYFFANENINKYYKIKDLLKTDFISRVIKKGAKIGIIIPYEHISDKEKILELKTHFDKEFGITNSVKFYKSVVYNPYSFQWFDGKIDYHVSKALYSDIGFYYGITYPFYSYDFISRKKYNFLILPININYEGLLSFLNRPKFLKREICKVKNLLNKFNGQLIVNWQNTLPYDQTYSKLNSLLPLILR